MNIRTEPWGTTPDGKAISLVTLTNDKGMTVKLTNVGACIVSVDVPDREGTAANVCLGYDKAEDYLTNPSGLGATCGRYANRIGKGRFTLDGEEYQLAINNGPNHLHGGDKRFNHYLWEQAEPKKTDDSASITFTHVSPDGDEGYPGELTVTLTYSLNNDNELTLDYRATTTEPTVLNLTNHGYWNLAGVDGGKVYDHLLTLHADGFLEVDSDVLPTGEVHTVEGTPFDFTKPKVIGADIKQAGGYDHCFAIDDWNKSLRLIARVEEPKSGRVLEIETTEPGVQLYTANHFDGSQGCAGKQSHEFFCLECQHFPDSPNQPEFPSTVLRPGEEYTQRTIHRFKVE